jgi:hypothetical protein
MGSERIERIRERAHAIWDREGRPEGRDVEHWQAASAEIDAEDAAAAPTASSGSESRQPKRRVSRQAADESAHSHTEGILSGATKRAAGAARRAVGAAKRTVAAIAGTEESPSGSSKTKTQTSSRSATVVAAPAAATSAASGAPGRAPSRRKSAEEKSVAAPATGAKSAAKSGDTEGKGATAKSPRGTSRKGKKPAG